MTDLVITIPATGGARPQKGPDACENIGCLQKKQQGRNKCPAHLQCQRAYSRKYQKRKREELQKQFKDFQDCQKRLAEQTRELMDLRKRNGELEREAVHWKQAYHQNYGGGVKR